MEFTHFFRGTLPCALISSLWSTFCTFKEGQETEHLFTCFHFVIFSHKQLQIWGPMIIKKKTKIIKISGFLGQGTRRNWKLEQRLQEFNSKEVQIHSCKRGGNVCQWTVPVFQQVWLCHPNSQQAATPQLELRLYFPPPRAPPLFLVSYSTSSTRA